MFTRLLGGESRNRVAEEARKRDLIRDAATGDSEAISQLGQRAGAAVGNFLSRFTVRENRFAEREVRQEEVSQSSGSRLSRLISSQPLAESQPRDSHAPQKAEKPESSQIERKISEDWEVIGEDSKEASQPKMENPASENKGQVFENLQSRRVFSGRQQKSFADEDRVFKGGWAGCDYDSSPESCLAASSSSSSPVTPSSDISPLVKDGAKQQTPILCLGSVDYPHQKDVIARISEVISSVEDIEKKNFENIGLLRVVLSNLEEVRMISPAKGDDSDIAELDAKIHHLENSISRLLLKQTQETPQKMQEEIQKGYVVLAAQFGETFERDFESAEALILQAHEMEGKSIPQHEVTWEVLKSMEKILVPDKVSGESKIISNRNQIGRDALTPSSVWFIDSEGDKHLLTCIGEEFYDIANPNRKKEKGYSFGEDPIRRYNFADILAYAKECDPSFQEPEISAGDARGRWKWMGEQVDKFLDQQGVSLLERHRIYSEAHQGALDCLTAEELSKEHLERARDKNLSMEVRFIEYYRAGFKVGRVTGPPNPTKWDAAFVAYFETRDPLPLTGMLSSRIHIIDLQKKCVECHYLMSYLDPIDKDRKTYHYHIQYDYVRDKRAIKGTEGVEEFPHPATVSELPRFSFAQVAAQSRKVKKAQRV